MASPEGILQIARDISGINWQPRPGCDIDRKNGDQWTFPVYPVEHPDELGDFVLVFVTGDPEEGKLEPQLVVYTMEQYLDVIALAGEHTE